MLPYLLGERAPHWSSIPRGAYVGLTRAHHREHLVRAALEGVCLQLAVVLDSLRDAGTEVRELRATGGFARSALWRQMLADVLGLEIGFPAAREGTSFGAALLGMRALGHDRRPRRRGGARADPRDAPPGARAPRRSTRRCGRCSPASTTRSRPPSRELRRLAPDLPDAAPVSAPAPASPPP